MSELKCCKKCGAFITCTTKGECCPECEWFDPIDNVCMSLPKAKREKPMKRDEEDQDEFDDVDPETFLFEDDDEDDDFSDLPPERESEDDDEDDFGFDDDDDDW
ncbi:MAG: hypothetical protein ACFFE2_13095 [Candidatus Thorarchaeota archaeon]